MESYPRALKIINIIEQFSMLQFICWTLKTFIM